MADPFTPQPQSDVDQSVDRTNWETSEWKTEIPPFDDDAGTVRRAETIHSIFSLKLLAVVVCVIFTARLAQLQVTVSAQYRNLSEGNSIRAKRLPADRGLVFDRNGLVLARNTKKAALLIRLENLPKEAAERDLFYSNVHTIIPITDEQIDEIETIRTKLTGDYIISTKVENEPLLLLKELAHQNAALILDEKPVRQYEPLPSIGHILGYVGQVNTDDVEQGYSSLDVIGKSGLEKTYEDPLRGIFGVQEVAVDAHGRFVQEVASNHNREPSPGKSLRLSIDSALQTTVATAVANAMTLRNEQYPDTKDLGATVILMEPKTGLVRALVSLPSYDNNLFAQGISQTEYATINDDPTKPLFNRATNGLYPPGSTIKPLVAAGALHNKVVSPSYSLDTPTAITIGNFSFPDWKDHGVTNIRTAIAESNNIFFYMLGGGWQNVKGLGFERLIDTMRIFGLEGKTGIDTGSESAGFLLSEEWKKEKQGEPIYLGDVYHLSIGQGDILVTPIQMATATAAIANNGTLLEPRFAASYVDAKNVVLEEIPPAVRGQLPYDSTTLQIVRDGMRQAVVSGSSRPLAAISHAVAGKTGTAQFGSNDRTHAWFTGFAPYDDPEIVVTVLVEGGGGSFDVAVPLAEEALRAYFNEPKPQPEPKPEVVPTDAITAPVPE